jgi:heat shock protein HtpX
MRHRGLQFRMFVAGGMLFVFYLLLALFLLANGFPLALVLVGTVLFAGVQYKFGKWAALRSVGAEDLPEDQYQQLHWTVGDLSEEMGIEKPRLMIADMGVPNAFAVGRKGAGVVVLSTELMEMLDREELDGVVAHELAHIRNRDVVLMVMGQSIASMVGIAAWMLATRQRGGFFVGLIASQIAQMLVLVFVFAISRYREYVADEDAATAIGSGEPLARALEKIDRGHASSASIGGRGRSRDREPGRGSAFDAEDRVGALCIFNEERGLLQRAFATHPPTEKRIERLRSRY